MARILVIDDDPDVCAVIQETLESANHEVIVANDGNQGLSFQRLHRADLVIIDILMPEKEGIETIRDLRQEFPRQKIIAMSGGGRASMDVDYLKIAKQCGAHSMLRKPFSSNRLLDSVLAALNGDPDGAGGTAQ